MERNERTRANALDHYWDGVAHGEAPASAFGLDAELATLVMHLHAAGSAVTAMVPDPDQAWHALRADRTPQVNTGEPAFSPWTQANGHVDLATARELAPPSPRRRGGRGLNLLATAALLLLTTIVGIWSVSPRAPQAPDEGNWMPALVRAVGDAPGVIDAPLVETNFALAALPSGEKEAHYYQIIIPPGGSLPYLGGAFCGCRYETIVSGVGVEVVQSGSYTLQLEAPFRVQRAGEPRPGEEIPAGAEVTLGAGDVAIYADYAAAGDIRNDSEEPLTLLGVAIVSTEGSGTPVPLAPSGVRATLLAYVPPIDWKTMPPGPLNLALRQMSLQPGSSIGAYQPVGLQALRIESGMISRSFFRAGDTTPSGPPLVQATGSTISSVQPGSGLRETLVNTGVGPAELLVLIIEPAVSGVQSLGG